MLGEERGLDGKGVINFFSGETELWVFRVSNYKFYFTNLFDSQFTCILKDVLFFTHAFSFFHFIKSFLIVLYFINSLFNKKSV